MREVSGERWRVGVAGATGYAGQELVALLGAHPGVLLEQVSSRSAPGRRHGEVCPGSECQLELVADLDGGALDVVISALPHLEAAALAPGWLDAGALVIDVSADFRLRDPAQYHAWYGAEHPAPHLLGSAVLALPELRPDALAEARLISLPGCFSTATVLACAPAVAAGLVEDEVIVDGKTGVSGAGKGAGSAYLFSELNESVRGYALGGHRHSPEMVQVLSELRGGPVRVTFVPHLVPMTRGIAATCYLRPRPGVDLGALIDRYRDAYRDSPFVHLWETPPPTKVASYTNHCFIHLAQQGELVVVEGVLDNLGRGAAGQAVQVLNQRLGLPATAGLERGPWWP